PYANVNCTLTLLKGSVRQSQLLRDGKYAREEEDDRFNDYFGSVQSIVTSSAQSDTGLFETNLRDERYLPFENSGTISQWQLELPANPSKDDPMQFDYDTISDVILHIRYTAREGGALLRRGAIENLKTAMETAQAAGSVRLFSLRHEFPTEWAKFRSAPSGNIAELKLNLRNEHYPFWSRGRLDKIKKIELLTNKQLDVRYKPGPEDEIKARLKPDPSFGKLRRAELPNDTGQLLEKPTGELKLYLSDNTMKDLFLVVTWHKAN
ncbi:MAG TPA: hypothetical protein VIT23_00230, partial [Terrimicrobiaceae bacterium]